MKETWKSLFEYVKSLLMKVENQKVVCEFQESWGLLLNEFVGTLLWILRFCCLLGEELHWDTARPAGWNPEWLQEELHPG